MLDIGFLGLRAGDLYIMDFGFQLFPNSSSCLTAIPVLVVILKRMNSDSISIAWSRACRRRG